MRLKGLKKHKAERQLTRGRETTQRDRQIKEAEAVRDTQETESEKKERVSEEVGEGPGCDGPETLFYGLSEASLLPDTA